MGLRGIRIQNVVSELNGEKIDVIAWSQDSSVFIANALSPAQVVRVMLDENNKTATVVIPDKQLSLAIGKEGQNVRLAVRLAGWRIDIISVSKAEDEKLKAKEAAIDEVEKEAGEEPEVVTEPLMPPADEAAGAATGKKKAEEEEGEAIPLAALEEAKAAEGEKAKEEQPVVRFAEDIVKHIPPDKVESKPKKKKKKTTKGKDSAQDGVKIKKRRRNVVDYGDEDDYE